MQRRLSWSTVRSRLVAGTVILTLVALAAVAVYTFSAYQKATSDLVVERDRQLAYLSAARLREEMTRFADELWALARTPEIVQGTRLAQAGALERARNRLVIFDGGIVLLDNFGRVRASVPERPEIDGVDWSNRDYFRQALTSSSTYLSDIVRDGPNGSMVVVMSVPVTGSRGEFLGVLAGMFRIGAPTSSSFYASIVRLRLGQSGTTYVVDGARRLLYNSTLQGFGDETPIPGVGAATVVSSGALRTRDEFGFDVVAAYAPVPGTRWTLVTEDDWNSLTASVRVYVRNLLLLLALGILLPPIGVAMLVRQQQSQIREREHMEQETRVATLIQQNLLPKQPPSLPSWNLAIHYHPAGGGGKDFYDFAFLPDGRLMLALGEVDDRGLLAAHLIGATRATLRGGAQRLLSPAEALDCSNTLLNQEVPAGTTLSCLYAVLDPQAGQIELATAGDIASFWHSAGGVSVLHTPQAGLGAVFDTVYSQTAIGVQDTDRIVLCTNGLVEARSPQGEAFGAERVRTCLEEHPGTAQETTEALMKALQSFTRKGRNQADDVTLIVLERLPRQESGGAAPIT